MGHRTKRISDPIGKSLESLLISDSYEETDKKATQNEAFRT